jgi:hypothetical protein
LSQKFLARKYRCPAKAGAMITTKPSPKIVVGNKTLLFLCGQVVSATEQSTTHLGLLQLKAIFVSEGKLLKNSFSLHPSIHPNLRGTRI